MNRYYNRRKQLKRLSFGHNNNCPRRRVTEYFHKSSNFDWRTKVILAFVLFVLIYFTYFFLFSEYFIIKTITVEGNQEISVDEINNITNDLLNKRRFLFFKNSNYFLFNIEKLEEELLNNYYLDNLEIEKRDYSSLFIKLKERPSKLIYQVGNRNYLVDKDGLILSIHNIKELDQDILL
ncbi:FtsQ-type POTRA domain-containing protein, partial [bacterium]|nr:FtsQ-type POTRA domain-containing protein [bacterium]